MRQRQIHLDFHTSPHIPGVAADFDADAFAATMAEAGVESVNVFAKCHHGHLYTRSTRPERHPGLAPGRDLLGEQIAALHRRGIAAPIYLSLLVDEYAATTHPDWVARGEDGAPVAFPWLRQPRGPFDDRQASWATLDCDSPYLDHLCAQLDEVLAAYGPVDGLWFDMCWDVPSCSSWAIAAMDRAGLDPRDPEHRRRHAAALSQRVMTRLAGMVRAHRRDAGMYFNVRPLGRLRAELAHFGQIEIESLPTGGWGYLHFQRTIRRVRRLGLPCVGMTARFHAGWGDFGGLKPQAALDYEASLMLAHGAACSIGDQLHPRGTLDREAYARIGRTYRRLARLTPWTEGAVPEADIAVLVPPPPPGDHLGAAPAVDGAVRLLLQLQQQFDLVEADGDLAGYRQVIVPEDVPVDAALAARLDASGAAVLVAGATAGADLAACGLDDHGPSPFSTVYLRPAAGAPLPASDQVVPEPSRRLAARSGTEVLATAVEPYFERSWRRFSSHRQTPPDQATTWVLAAIRGHRARIAFGLFGAYARQASPLGRELLAWVLARLLPEPLVRLPGAPTTAEATVCRLGTRRIVHVLHAVPVRRAPDIDLIEDVLPLREVTVSLRADLPATRARLVPDGPALPLRRDGGRLSCTIPEVLGHAVVELA